MDWTPTLKRLSRLKVSEQTLVRVKGDDPKRFVNNLRSILHGSKRTRDDHWTVQLRGKFVLVTKKEPWELPMLISVDGVQSTMYVSELRAILWGER